MPMTRDKQQVLYQFLPEKVFDHNDGAVARVTAVHGRERDDISREFLMQSIREAAGAWDAASRPNLPDRLLNDSSQFVFIEPEEVVSELFPLVFWCDNVQCGYVVELSRDRELRSAACPKCSTGRLYQLPFVLMHECGRLAQWAPPACPKCHSKSNMALQRRGSQISNARWWCLRCQAQAQPLAGRCPCGWSDTARRIFPGWRFELFRSGRSMYAQTVTVVNQPGPDSARILATPGWQFAAGSIFLGLPESSGYSLSEWAVQFGQRSDSASPAVQADISNTDLNDLLQRVTRGEISLEEMTAQVGRLQNTRQTEREALGGERLLAELVDQTGCAAETWMAAGHELLETLSLRQANRTSHTVTGDPARSSLGSIVATMGIAEISVVTDFPVSTAVYGFTRLGAAPHECWLNPFPRDQRYGRIPIYTDVVEADALIVRLNPLRMIEWLEHLGFSCHLAGTGSDEVKARAYFVELFNGTRLRETIGQELPEVRLVFGTLHTMCHLAIRHAALLCGLDVTSMSEYLLPRSLSFAIFCNHRFGATIGALLSLFEQTLESWLLGLRDADSCVYDPVCSSKGGVCHSCVHLSETSCRFFNLNLGRPFLFGGTDKEIGQVTAGYVRFNEGQ